jgi:hypothetical protein
MNNVGESSEMVTTTRTKMLSYGFEDAMSIRGSTNLEIEFDDEL